MDLDNNGIIDFTEYGLYIVLPVNNNTNSLQNNKNIHLNKTFVTYLDCIGPEYAKLEYYSYLINVIKILYLKKLNLES